MQMVSENNVKSKHVFKDYAYNWFEVFSKPNIEQATIATYDRCLKLHIVPHLGEMYIEEITPMDIQKIFNSMNGARETKTKVKNIMNMIFNQAIEDGYIVKNPIKSNSIRITGRNPNETKPYSIEQMKYLMKKIDDIHEGMDRTFLALIATHPLRLEEVLGLKNEDVDMEKGLIHITRAVTHPTRNRPVIKETKTTASNRIIKLVPQIIPYLKLGTDPDQYVFGGEKPLSQIQVKRMCQRIKRQTEFEENITPRRFRTTVLTDIYNVTKDVKQAQLAAGHTTAAMTLKHYVKGRNTGSSETANAIASAYGLEGSR